MNGRAYGRQRTVLYVVLCTVLLLWGTYFARKWAAGQLQLNASHTSAVIYQASSDLQNLPSPNIIVPAGTSGNAAGVITNYQTTVTKLRQASNSLSIPLLHRLLHPQRANRLATAQKHAKQTLNSAASTLTVTANALQASKKFIEYDPTADLAGLDTPGSDAGERLQRTKQGLLDTATDLQRTKYPYAVAMAAQLPALASSATTLTDISVPAWANRVLVVQTDYVHTFQSNWNTYIHSTAERLQQYATST